MASINNNNACKKQKIIEAVDNGGNLSLPTTPAVVVSPALSFGNILKEFPDFLFCVLSYIADRMIWNSIASSNKDMYDKSKTILPPWPLCYKIPSLRGDRWSWSPCGTRIACSANLTNIVVFDQRFGPLRNNGHINAHVGYRINSLKYSPNGKFLISTGNDGFLRLWDAATGNCEQLQEWNMKEEAVNVSFGFVFTFCVSACSKYIAVSLRTCVLLKNVEDGGKTISFIAPNENKIYINNLMFSSNNRAIFLCCREENDDVAIRIWRPYLDDDDEDRLITLWRQANSNRYYKTSTSFSNDNTMVAIYDEYLHKGTVWSIDTNHKCLTKKVEFPISTGLYFTPDGKYIIYNKENGSTLWSIPEGRFTNNTLRFWDNGNNTKHNLEGISFSPNNRQLIIQECSGDLYITSYLVK